MLDIFVSATRSPPSARASCGIHHAAPIRSAARRGRTRARARTTLSRRFFLRQFCSRGPRRRPAPPGRAKAAPIRRIADPRQSRRHRECRLLPGRCRPRRRERPCRHHNVCSDRAQLPAANLSGFRRRLCRSSDIRSVPVRPFTSVSSCVPRAVFVCATLLARDRRGQCPGTFQPVFGDCRPAGGGDPARESAADTAESPAVPEPRQRGDALVAARARRVPRARRRLQQCRIRRRARRRLFPVARPPHGDGDREARGRDRPGAGRARRRQERRTDRRAVHVDVRSPSGIRRYRQREGHRRAAGRPPGDRLRRSAAGRPRGLAQRRADVRCGARDDQDGSRRRSMCLPHRSCACSTTSSTRAATAIASPAPTSAAAGCCRAAPRSRTCSIAATATSAPKRGALGIARAGRRPGARLVGKLPAGLDYNVEMDAAARLARPRRRARVGGPLAASRVARRGRARRASPPNTTSPRATRTRPTACAARSISSIPPRTTSTGWPIRSAGATSTTFAPASSVTPFKATADHASTTTRSGSRRSATRSTRASGAPLARVAAGAASAHVGQEIDVQVSRPLFAAAAAGGGLRPSLRRRRSSNRRRPARPTAARSSMVTYVFLAEK